MMKLVIHPAALEEASAAIMFYDDRRLGLGRRFLDNLNEALRRTETDPLSFPLYEGSRREIPHRRVLVSRFPYVVAFFVESGCVYVTAIAHTSRRPGYWATRQFDS